MEAICRIRIQQTLVEGIFVAIRVQPTLMLLIDVSGPQREVILCPQLNRSQMHSLFSERIRIRSGIFPLWDGRERRRQFFTVVADNPIKAHLAYNLL